MSVAPGTRCRSSSPSTIRKTASSRGSRSGAWTWVSGYPDKHYVFVDKNGALLDERAGLPGLSYTSYLPWARERTDSTLFRTTRLSTAEGGRPGVCRSAASPPTPTRTACRTTSDAFPNDPNESRSTVRGGDSRPADPVGPAEQLRNRRSARTNRTTATMPQHPSSDSDGDGVGDNADECDDEPGPRTDNGCPQPTDSDKDGVPDDQDAFPNDPNESQSDSDGDGWATTPTSVMTSPGPPATTAVRNRPTPTRTAHRTTATPSPTTRTSPGLRR